MEIVTIHNVGLHYKIKRIESRKIRKEDQEKLYKITYLSRTSARNVLIREYVIKVFVYIYVLCIETWGYGFSCEAGLDRKVRVFCRHHTLGQSPAEEGRELAAYDCYGGFSEAQYT